MSAQLYSVTIRCEHCDEVFNQSGVQRKDATVSLLRSKIHKLGWKSARVLEGGKLVTQDYCPYCSFERGLG